MTTTMTGTPLSSAQALFARGTDCLGAAEIKAIGLEVEASPILFTEEDLVVAHKRSEILVYHPPAITMQRVHELTENKCSDDQPFFYDIGWYRNEAFYTNDPLRTGWRLVSREPIAGSRSNNYLGQTEALVAHLKDVVYANQALPNSVAVAVAEFEAEKKALARLLNSDWQEAAKRLVSLKLNQLFREKPSEAAWLNALYERVNRERLLPPGSWSWTNQLSSDGGVVCVGGFDEDGLDVGDDDPRSVDDYLGFRFSRSVELES